MTHNEWMPVDIHPYSSAWPAEFERVATELHRAVDGIPGARVEHVGSTAVPGLAAKPILDIDVIVETGLMDRAVLALSTLGYASRGDLGITDRVAMRAPDAAPARHVYVCAAGSLAVRNHLGVRDVLRRDAGLREEYARVKRSLAADPGIDMARYIAGKSAVLQRVLALTSLTEAERAEILRANEL